MAERSVAATPASFANATASTGATSTLVRFVLEPAVTPRAPQIAVRVDAAPAATRQEEKLPAEPRRRSRGRSRSDR